jgi:hypothetical protein
MGTAFDMNTDTKVWMKSMKLIGNNALPESVAETLNITADSVTKQQMKNVQSDFIVRSKFTMNSMKTSRSKPYLALNTARGKNLQRMFSRAGTFSSYLWKQEDGGTFVGLSGPVPIATKAARTSRKENKAIAKKNRLSASLPLTDGSIENNQFIGNVNGKRGIYQRTKKGGLTMLRNLDSDSIKIKGTNFHQKAVDRKGSKQLVSTRFRRIAQKRINKAVRRG